MFVAEILRFMNVPAGTPAEPIFSATIFYSHSAESEQPGLAPRSSSNHVC